MVNQQNAPSRKRRLGGFSLVELMVVLAVTVILLTVAIPAFYSWVQQQRLLTTANEFFAAVILTRSEAIQLGRRVDMAARDGANWASGWIVFVDDNGNRVPDTGERILLTRDPVADGMSVTSVFTDSSRPYLAYNGTGRSRTDTSGQSPQLGTVTFSLNDKVRRIKLNFAGRPRACDPKSDRTCTGADS